MSTPGLQSTPEVTVVTGAAGWFGSGLLNAFADLASQWHRPGTVRALVETATDRDRLAALSNDDLHITPVVGDIRDPDTLAALFRDLDGTTDLIHAAGVIHPAALDDFTSINVDGTKGVLVQAAANGVRRVVHVSSNSPFGTNAGPDDRFAQHEPYRPYLSYGRSKMEAELAVLDAASRGLNAVIVRPPWFYGPHQPARQTTFFQMVRKGQFPIFGRGDQLRSMTYIDNLVQGVCRAELVDTEPGAAWWVADAEPYTVNEIVNAVADALADAGYDVAPNRVRLPNLIANLAERGDRALQAAGRYQTQLHVLGEMNKNIACDIAATRRELGYNPTVSIREGMMASVRWCQQQGYEL